MHKNKAWAWVAHGLNGSGFRPYHVIVGQDMESYLVAAAEAEAELMAVVGPIISNHSKPLTPVLAQHVIALNAN